METPQAASAPAAARWRPVAAVDRRVLGVLVEKAKTTPDGYPMTASALVAGCNQKSNRHPQVQLDGDDVEASIARLRELGAVGVVQGGGRVDKYRHYLYDWLGVDKVELAVMAELLLRGAQTEGELRGRAARMEPIADLGALRPVLDSLKAKGLVLGLTAAGRGHVVTHALYEPRELEKLRAEFADGRGPQSDEPHGADGTLERAGAEGTSAWQPTGAARAAAAAAHDLAGVEAAVAELRREVGQLREELAQLRSHIGV